MLNKTPPVRVVKTVNQIRNGMSKLHKNLVPAPVAMLEMICSSWISQAISVAASLGVADFISEGGTSVDALAKAAGAHPRSLYRLLRALTVVGLFIELEGQRFRLTSLGKTLKTDHPQSMRHMAIFQGQINWEHWGALEHCVRTGTNAVEHIHGEKPFEHLTKHPEKAKVFDTAMTNISAMERDSILAVYDFSPYKVIADIGGGHGALLAAILSETPSTQAILFDLPHVVREASERLGEVKNRIVIKGGSFFAEIPGGADAYMMKHIIHDWSDAESLAILKNIRAQIPAAGKLILFETVVPDPNVTHFSKVLDLEMLVVTTGHERTESEFAKLLNQAGFALERVIPTVSMTCVLEAKPI